MLGGLRITPDRFTFVVDGEIDPPDFREHGGPRDIVLHLAGIETDRFGQIADRQTRLAAPREGIGPPRKQMCGIRRKPDRGVAVGERPIETLGLGPCVGTV